MMILKVAALFVGSIICIVAVFSCIMAEEKAKNLMLFLRSLSLLFSCILVISKTKWAIRRPSFFIFVLAQ